MNVFELTEKDWDYVRGCIKNGTDVLQALAQLDVLREESQFKENLISALHHPDVIREIQRIIRESQQVD